MTSGINLELWSCTRLIIYIWLGGGYDYKLGISSNLASLLGLYHEIESQLGTLSLLSVFSNSLTNPRYCKLKIDLCLYNLDLWNVELSWAEFWSEKFNNNKFQLWGKTKLRRKSLGDHKLLTMYACLSKNQFLIDLDPLIMLSSYLKWIFNIKLRHRDWKCLT